MQPTVQRGAQRDRRSGEHPSFSYSSGSSCSRSTTGANRSPCASTRSSTSCASNTSASGSPASTSSQDSGVDTVGRSRAQGVDGDRRLLLVVLAPVDQD